VAWTDPQSGETTSRREQLPDPQRDTMVALIQRIEELEQKVHDLEAAQVDPDAHRTFV
jgi:hypothetical protein